MYLGFIYSTHLKVFHLCVRVSGKSSSFSCKGRSVFGQRKYAGVREKGSLVVGLKIVTSRLEDGYRVWTGGL